MKAQKTFQEMRQNLKFCHFYTLSFAFLQIGFNSSFNISQIVKNQWSTLLRNFQSCSKLFFLLLQNFIEKYFLINLLLPLFSRARFALDAVLKWRSFIQDLELKPGELPKQAFTHLRPKGGRFEW